MGWIRREVCKNQYQFLLTNDCNLNGKGCKMRIVKSLAIPLTKGKSLVASNAGDWVIDADLAVSSAIDGIAMMALVDLVAQFA